MTGVITFKHVFRHSGTVITEFGVKVYCRCILAVIRGEQKTFLAIAFDV